MHAARSIKKYFGIKGADARRTNARRKEHQKVFWNKGCRCKAHEDETTAATLRVVRIGESSATQQMYPLFRNN